MNDLKQGDGVIAVCSDGKKRFGTIDGRFGSRLGVTFQSQLMPKPKFEFINPENITPLYSLGDGFDVLFDSNPYQYPCKFSVYDWQLHVTHQRKPLCVPKNENTKPHEASIYYQQVEPPDPELLIYTRLHDVYVSMLDVLSAVDYVKDVIRTPPIDDDGDSVFQRILTNHWIPYKLLQWQSLTQTDETFYQCRTEPFVTANGCKRILRIQVQCLDGKEQLPKY